MNRTVADRIRTSLGMMSSAGRKIISLCTKTCRWSSISALGLHHILPGCEGLCAGISGGGIRLPDFLRNQDSHAIHHDPSLCSVVACHVSASSPIPYRRGWRSDSCDKDVWGRYHAGIVAAGSKYEGDFSIGQAMNFEYRTPWRNMIG